MKFNRIVKKAVKEVAEEEDVPEEKVWEVVPKIMMSDED